MGLNILQKDTSDCDRTGRQPGSSNDRATRLAVHGPTVLIEEINVDDLPEMSNESMKKILSISEMNSNRVGNMSQEFNKMYQ